MKEIKAILKAYDHMDHTTTRAALATVVRVEGSSYRRTGARMLVMDNGTWVGGISGGCLEGDALKRARLAIAKTTPSLITYDTTEDDAHQIGVGLGCNGIIDVLLAPIFPDEKNNPMAILRRVITDHRQANVLLTITQLEGEVNGLRAGHMIRSSEMDETLSADFPELVPALPDAVEDVLQNSRSATLSFLLSDGREIRFFAEFLPPELHVVLMGHQYDVYPLVRVLHEAGWRITLVANPQKIHREVAQLAQEIIAPEIFDPSILDSYTAVILMSHDYKTDKRHFPLVLASQTRYLGMLGPRVRAEKIFREVTEEGTLIKEQDMERIFAPVGLDIGAVTPEEIALSIAAEIRAVFSARQGRFLRQRPSTIHER
ncbi:XdhC family protein [Arundinibacter roseus]|uniref:XdhC family protein n=1 Tax=Arundinibacter roseus TaxID=2070510 RepID=A0A4R4KGJ9_9BACT|nr:XdhC family protein [Arundinibacter roseus]TDB66062.1 XdhC family protein [Arundinibacter roseus]